MHLDRFGDLGHGQRLQCRDPVFEEALLLLDDLGGDADDGAGTLVERLHQPVGAGEMVAEPALGGLVVGPRLEFGMVAAVDQHARQSGIVELDVPPRLGPRDEHVRGDAVRLLGDEAAAGLGIIGAQLADHVG